MAQTYSALVKKTWVNYGHELERRKSTPHHRKLAETLPVEVLANATLQEILVHTDSLVKTIEALRQNLKEIKQPTVRREIAKKPAFKLMTVKEYANHINRAKSTVYDQIRAHKLDVLQERPGCAIRIKVYES